MGICIVQYRAAIGLFNNCSTTDSSSLSFVQLFITLIILLGNFCNFLLNTIIDINSTTTYLLNSPKISLNVTSTIVTLAYTLLVLILLVGIKTLYYTPSRKVFWLHRLTKTSCSILTHVIYFVMFFQLIYVLYFEQLCILSGDVKTNPGPASILLC